MRTSSRIAAIRAFRVVVLNQVDRKLHRKLGRRPLARVMGADVHVDRSSVIGCVNVGGDLDSLDRTPFERGTDRDLARDLGLGLGEILEVGRVIGVFAVGRAAARKAGANAPCGHPRIGAPVGGIGGSQVGDQRGDAESGVLHAEPFFARVEDHRRRIRVHRVRDVDPQPLQLRDVIGARDRDASELDRLDRLRQTRSLERDRERDARRAAVTATALKDARDRRARRRRRRARPSRTRSRPRQVRRQAERPRGPSRHAARRRSAR